MEKPIFAFPAKEVVFRFTIYILMPALDPLFNVNNNLKMLLGKKNYLLQIECATDAFKTF